MTGSYRIDVVRGRLGDELSDRLVRFWTGRGALGEPQARTRLRDVVCVLFDGPGELAGVSSVSADAVPLLGGRSFWIYRMLLASGTPEDAPEALLSATRDELEREFADSGRGPIGVCVPIADPELIARYPEAVWEETKMIYAGYTANGVQIRVSYFEEARV